MFFIGSLLYYLYYQKEINSNFILNKNKIIYVFLLGFFSLFITTILYYNAIINNKNISTIIIITSIYPIITLLFILIFKKNNIKINTIIGMLLIFIGIIFSLYKN
jgi:transporter family protein